MLGLCCCTQAVSSYSAWGSHFCDFCCHGAWALLSQAMGDLQGPGRETVSLALTAEFLTTGLPGKSPKLFFFYRVTCCLECGKGEKGLWRLKVTSWVH